MTELMQVARECGNFKLRKASRVVTRVYARFTRDSGLKPSQFSLLVALSLQGPLGMGALAEVMAMERTTLTRNLRPLEKEGLVEVKPGADRRTRQVECTGAGRRCLERTLPAWREAQAYMAEELGRERWQALRGLLDDAARVPVPD